MKKKYFLIHIALISLFLNFFSAQEVLNFNLKEFNYFPGSNPRGVKLFKDRILFSTEDGGNYYRNFYSYNIDNNNYTILKNWTNKGLVVSPFYELNGKLYCFVDSGYLQLWSLNVETESVTQIKEFDFGIYSSDKLIGKVVNNKLVFAINEKLFFSDGTEAGTENISNIRFIGKDFIFSNNKLFFIGSQAYEVYQTDYYVTDGTTSGTKKINNPELLSTVNPYSDKIFSLNDKVIFSAKQSSNLSLWISDGTDDGTVKLANTSMSFLLDHDTNLSYKKIIFQKADGNWITDGTEEGTKLLKSSIFGKVFSFKDKQYVNLGRGFIYIVDENDNVDSFEYSFEEKLQILGTSSNQNYLILKEENNDDSFIYVYNGVELVKTDIRYNQDDNFVEKGNKIFFSGYKDFYQEQYSKTKNTELCYYNTVDQTSGIEKEVFYSGYSVPSSFVTLNDVMFFVASDAYYAQIFKLENGNYSKLSDFSDYSSSSANFGSLKHEISGNYIYYYGDKNSFFYRTMGSAESTKKISLGENERIEDVYSLNENSIIIKSYNHLYGFMRLWTLDNTSEKIALLLESPANDYSRNNKDFVKTDSGVYVKMLENDKVSIWKTNGTESSTLKIADLDKQFYSDKTFLGITNNKIIFVEIDSYGNSDRLFSIDDITGNIELINDSFKINSNHSFTINKNVYFFSNSDKGFYVTNGTAAGTYVIYSIPMDTVFSLTKCGDIVYINTNKDPSNSVFYRTDGTESGTFEMDRPPGVYSSIITCLNNELYYTSGNTFGKTKGTNPNDFTPIDVKFDNKNQDYYSYRIQNIYNNDNKIYFTANFSDHGIELYESDTIENLDVIDHVFSMKKERLLIYPNPSGDIINVKLNNGEAITKIEIYDLMGKKYIETQSTSLDLGNLATGLYLVKITTSSNKTYTSKLIKK